MDSEQHQSVGSSALRGDFVDAMNKKYSDNSSGVLQMLSENSSSDLKGATLTPDPCHRGVWGVRLKDGHQVVAYLAGYSDPWGFVREINDFEDDF